MRTTHPLLLMGLLAGCGGDGTMGPPGPPGPAGGPGTPTLSLSTPEQGFIARSVTVQLLGFATHFSKSSTVSFGDAAIQVGAVTAGSTGLLQFGVQIGATVTLGQHAITVTTGSEKVTLQNGFTVLPELVADAIGNDQTVPQGGLAAFSLTNADAGASPLPGAGALLLSAPLKGAGALAASASHVSGVVLVDALHPVGALSVGLSAGVSGASYLMSPTDANGPKVVARAPTALTVGAPLTGQTIMVSGNQRSLNNLYKFTSTADNQVAQITLTQAGPLMFGNTVGVVAPSSGAFSAGQIFQASDNAGTETGLAYLPKAGSQHLALYNTSMLGGPGSEFILTVKVAAATSFSSKEATPDSPTMPVAKLTLSGPMYSTDGSFASAADTAYITITPGKAGNLYVLASSDAFFPGSTTLPAVSLLAADCVTTLPGTVPGARPSMAQAAVVAGTTYCAAIKDLSLATDFPHPFKLVVSTDL